MLTILDVQPPDVQPPGAAATSPLLLWGLAAVALAALVWFWLRRRRSAVE